MRTIEGTLRSTYVIDKTSQRNSDVKGYGFDWARGLTWRIQVSDISIAKTRFIYLYYLGYTKNQKRKAP